MSRSGSVANNPTGGPDVLEIVRSLQEQMQNLQLQNQHLNEAYVAMRGENEQLTEQIAAIPSSKKTGHGYKIPPPSHYDGKNKSV